MNRSESSKSSGNSIGSARIYWDQATGILLESTGSLTETQFSITLAETTLWSGGLFGLDKIFIIVVVAVVIIAVVAGFMLRRKRAQGVPAMAQGVPPPPPPPSPP